MGELLKHHAKKKNHAKWNKPDTKEQILYDSTYIRCLELTNSRRERK